MSVSTNFEGAARINTLVGNVPNPTDHAGHYKQLKLISDEIKEGEDNLLKLAISSEILRDDVQDILFTTYGLASRLGMGCDDVQLDPDVSNWDYVRSLEGTMSSPAKHVEFIRTAHDAVVTGYDLHREGTITTVSLTLAIRTLLKYTYLLAKVMGYPADDDFLEVVRSNMTKFDHTVEEAIETEEKYAAIGVKTVMVPVSYVAGGVQFNLIVTKSATNQVGTDGKEYPEAKWLKSIRFQEPIYRPL